MTLSVGKNSRAKITSYNKIGLENVKKWKKNDICKIFCEASYVKNKNKPI